MTLQAAHVLILSKWGILLCSTQKPKNLKSYPRKILPRFCGPFRVSQRIGLSAYKFVLPSTCKIHPVVHVGKVWKYAYLSNELQHPPPVFLGDADTFVLDILSHWGSPKNRQYLVQWKGKDIMYNTWDPKSSLSLYSQVVAQSEDIDTPAALGLASGCYQCFFFSQNIS